MEVFDLTFEIENIFTFRDVILILPKLCFFIQVGIKHSKVFFDLVCMFAFQEDINCKIQTFLRHFFIQQTSVQ